ncbi:MULTISPECIES: SDR family NAD(P)-dependent oxidoreductase [unclassified Pseudoclavibacter]|uniref:SDR family NAD(P)-dependent oxidoreductase n=1 Tax=unclassified Pseudoclavibacter TaxID=2615177 RepID=UPI001BAC2AEE|nr:SDR family oxidoreductase [Pseudoclavibacter sp. Marseille-Q4354]MBS3178207.1 SDR family oxidoreductase [Pseudoclavibacter sp. Marseille-Q4354]
MEGLVAVVTGGASGIGAAITERLRADGAFVVPFDLVSSEEGLVVDIGDDAAVRAAVDQVVEQHGRLDIVVNNAGISSVGSIEDNPDEEWHRAFDINVLGAVRVTRAALPHLRRSPCASVVNTCSIAASAGLPQRAVYGATKGALFALTLQMAADHLADGVRVNAVNPGTADTPWVQRLLAATEDPAAAREALEARQPSGRLVSAGEVAEAVAYLAGPGARSTTGTSLAVDGGMAGLRLPSARG